MRGARFFLAALVVLAAAGCIRHEPDDVAGRGLFNSQPNAPQAYAQQRLQPSSVLQYVPPRRATPQSVTPQTDAGESYAAAPRSYAASYA